MECKKYTLAHLLPLAIRSHQGTSFVPEKRGNSYVKAYSEELDSDLQQIADAGRKGEIIDEVIEAACTRYKAGYEKHLTAYLHSHSNVVSWMIVGPSNFPVRQMQKRSQWADNKRRDFIVWRERALKAILRNFKKVVDPLEKATKEMNQRKALAEKYRQINKALRSNKNNPQEQYNTLKQAGFNEKVIFQVLTPDYMGRTGIPQYMMSNNNANIKRLENRVKELSNKAAKAYEDREFKYAFSGGYVLLNYEADRVQIIYNAKPDAATITALKGKAFKWSPFHKAWQRKITANAINEASTLLGVSLG